MLCTASTLVVSLSIFEEPWPSGALQVHEKGIEPHIRVFDRSKRRDGTLERDSFTFNHQDDSYICPEGKRLRPSNRNVTSERSRVDQGGFIRYRASQHDCGPCALRQRCTPNTPARKIMRSMHEGAATWLAILPQPTPT